MFTTVSAAIAKTERTQAFATRTKLLVATAASLSKTVPTVSGIKSTKTTLIKKNIVAPKQSITKLSMQKKTKTIPTQKSITRTKSSSRSKSASNLKTKQVSKTKQKTRQATKTKQKTRQATKTKQKTITKQKAKQLQKQKAKQLQRQLQKQKQLLKQKQISTRISIPTKLGSPKLFPYIKLPKGFTQKKLARAQPTYYVITRKKGKIVKLYPKPLVMKDARDFLAYSIDNNLTKSAWFVPLGKKKNIIKPPKNIVGYYSKVSKKLRPYKIRQGKKKALLNGYIEKRKYFGDTAGEKRQLKSARKKARGVRRTTLKRRVVKRRPITKRKIVRRKMTPAQRKVMLRNLKKARVKKGGSKVSAPRRNTPRTRPTASKTTIKKRISPKQRRLLLLRLKKARMVRMRNLKRKR